MNLAFIKMQALGNDFVVIDALRHPVTLTATQRQFIANRHLGIGCDQLLLLEPAATTNADAVYRIFNADGGEVEQCGNGARCVAKYLFEDYWPQKTTIQLQTKTRIITAKKESSWITVDMGVPQLLAPITLEFQQQSFTLAQVDVGNPHAIINTTRMDKQLLNALGQYCNQSAHFPNGVNVEMAQVIDRDQLELMVFERGVGLTQACGTGACATAVAMIDAGLANTELAVKQPGGTLKIQWLGAGHAVWLSGPAEKVFVGSLLI